MPLSECLLVVVEDLGSELTCPRFEGLLILLWMGMGVESRIRAKSVRKKYETS